jgi:hypothetical protein
VLGSQEFHSCGVRVMCRIIPQLSVLPHALASLELDRTLSRSVREVAL